MGLDKWGHWQGWGAWVRHEMKDEQGVLYQSKSLWGGREENCGVLKHNESVPIYQRLHRKALIPPIKK